MKKVIAVLTTLMCPLSALASHTSQYEIGNTTKNIADILTGPVAYGLLIIAVVISGVMLAFVDLQTGAKKFVEAILGAAVISGGIELVVAVAKFNGAVI